MAEVRLEGVSKVYGEGVGAVHKATFDVGHGELVVLVGPSGCGKSTVLRMIAGLETVTAGTIRIGNRAVHNVAPKDRDVAMVFQNYALYPHMSVFDNMAFGLKLRKYSDTAIQDRVRKASEILGIGEVLDRMPSQLSGGQRQRVAVGRAMVRQPSVFLFDEPLSNLDARLRVQMRMEIVKLHRQLGATMIYVTHDQVEAMTMGDRIVVLEDGYVQQIDTPLALYHNPANRFVAGFIGSPSMNFLNGRIERDRELVFRSNEGGFTIQLDDAAASGVDPAQRGPVTLGIRPEDIYTTNGPHASPSHGRVDLILDVVEPLGSEVLVYARAATERGEEGQQIVARIAPQSLPEVGERIRLSVDVSKIHFFDSDTGIALARASSVASAASA